MQHTTLRQSVAHDFMSPTRQRGIAGFTVLEVLVTILVSGVIIGGVAVWALTTFKTQDVTRTQVAVARMVSKVNVGFVGDVAGAQFAVASTEANGSRRSDWFDCQGGQGAATKTDKSDILLVLVTPGDRRVVYTLVDDPAGNGKTLYRRDCANLKSLAGGASTLDPSLNDPESRFLNDPKGADLTTATQSSVVVSGVRDATLTEAASACPPQDDTSAYDVNCKTLKVSVSIEGRSEPLIFQATRRTDTYCSPSCPPTASFEVSNSAPNKGADVTLDARTSTDRRGGYYPPGHDEDYYALNPADRLHYHWDFDTTACEPSRSWATTLTGSAWPATDPPTPLDGSHPTSNGPVMPTVVFNKACTYTVTLTVTNNAGQSASTTRFVKVQGQRPLAQITNTPLPIRVVRNQSVNFASLIQTYEGDLDATASTWSWGDATPSVQLDPAVSNNNTTCTTPTLCTASNDLLSHRYTTPGVFVAVLTVTDSTGLKSTSIATVIVNSEYYYVSADPNLAHDSTDCGPIVPDYKPCRTIGYALQRAAGGTAENKGKTDILVAGGDYPAFDAVSGINVWGGRDDSGGQSASWAPKAGYPSVVAGLEVDGPPDRRAVTVSNISLPTMIADLTVRPGNAQNTDATVEGVVVTNSTNITLTRLFVDNGNGRNPTGVLVTGHSGVTIRDSDVRSGSPIQATAEPANRSAYGVRVLDGSNVSVQGGQIKASAGLAGVAGQAGTDDPSVACKGTDGAPYTQSPSTACSGEAGTAAGTYGGGGGEGGGYASAGGTGSDGELAQPASSQRWGVGGTGGWDVTPAPKAGKPGAGGSGAAATGAGSGGTGGSNVATSAGATWQGPLPTPAVNSGTSASSQGQPGGGGGGGGGTSIWYLFYYTPYEGAQGGGGGGGGRPAASAGSGGTTGGGSFGVYVHDSTLNVGAGADISAAKGGNGGAGGKGGNGGKGGDGGKGRAQDYAGDSSSGGGGGGGAGAGGGGGGASGPSVAVFSVGTGPVPAVADAQLTPTSGATPGPGGAAGLGGQGGAGGPDPGSSVGGDRAGKPGAPGTQGSPGNPGAKGDPGMVCKVFSSAASSNGCFESSIMWIKRSGPAELTNAGGPGGTLSWTVKFDSAVENVTGANFKLVGDGIANLTTLPITASGSGDTWTVSVSGITTTSAANGSVSLTVADVTGITHAGQQIADPSPKDFVGEQYVVDQNPPTVLSMSRVTDPLTNSGAVSWYVTFSEPVTGLAGNNFTFLLNGVTAPFVAETPSLLAGSTTVWEVTVNTGTNDGTITLKLSNDAVAVKDAAGNSLAGAPYTGDTYTIDKTPPRVESILRADPTSMFTNRGLASNPGDVKWRVTFTEPVMGVYWNGPFANFGLNPSVTGAALTGMTQIDQKTYDVTASTGTGEGDLLLDLTSGQKIQDPAGNAFNPEAGKWAGPPAVDGSHEKFVIDKTPPSVVITRGTGTPTPVFTNSKTSVQWTATFDGPVTGVVPGSFQVECGSACPPSTAMASDITLAVANPSGDQKTYVITATFGANSKNGSGQIQLTLTGAASTQVKDLAGNAGTTLTSTEAFTVDRKDPTTVSADRWVESTPGNWVTLATEWTNMNQVQVRFTTNDPADNYLSSGPEGTYFTTDGSDPTAAGTKAPGGVATIAAAGTTTVRYATKDNAGNWSSKDSLDVKIDLVRPETTLNITGAAGSDPGTNSYIGFAKLVFTATDPVGSPAQQSGVAGTYYTLDGSDPTVTSNVSRFLYDSGSPVILRLDQTVTVKYASVDNAGNIESPVKFTTFTITTHGPVFNSGVLAETCSDGSQGHMAVGAPVGGKVEDYVDAGCIKLSVDVSAYDALLPIDRIEFYRCPGNVNPCTPVAEGGTGVKIGVVTGASPFAVNTWRLASAQLLPLLPPTPGDERDYTIVAVAFDTDGTRSSSAVRTFGIDMTPPNAKAPSVDGKS